MRYRRRQKNPKECKSECHSRYLWFMSYGNTNENTHNRLWKHSSHSWCCTRHKKSEKFMPNETKEKEERKEQAQSFHTWNKRFGENTKKARDAKEKKFMFEITDRVEEKRENCKSNDPIGMLFMNCKSLPCFPTHKDVGRGHSIP